MRKATKRQVLELTREDPMMIMDAIGLNPHDVQFGVPLDPNSKPLKISVRPGLKSKVPEKIIVMIDGEEHQVDFDLDENFQVYLPL